MYADMGDHKNMQRVMDNKGIMERKNVFLQPIYRDLKSHIRFMSYTPEFQLVQEYVSARKQLESSFLSQPKSEQDKKLKQLQTHFADLLRIHNQKIKNKPAQRLKYL